MEIKFTDNNFEVEVLQFNGPVLVDFYAEWCGPCKMQGPIIEELAKEMEGKDVKVGTMDIDQNPKMTEQYEVMSVPTLILFKNGEVKEALHGVHNKDDLKEKLEALM